MTTRTTIRATALAAGLLLLAGCADGDDDPTVSTSTSPSASATTASPSPSASGSTSPSPSASASAAGFSLDDVTSSDFPDLGPDLGAWAKVRVGTHPGYDRVVWQFDGPDTATYRVRYVDEPRGEASGDPVDVEGNAFLEVVVTSVGYPDMDGNGPCPDLGDPRLSGTAFAEVSGICGGFEGMAQTFVGLDEERPFRVAVLENPSRLVVDVRTD
ncbi:hypothetical protein [Oryzobacter terrae]|uniref:AMIN-like domain-containing (lipo)protein n=1 Tax=Oryzobacter terrae TaxID=1620385 RepID=UPI0036723CBD